MESSAADVATESTSIEEEVWARFTGRRWLDWALADAKPRSRKAAVRIVIIFRVRIFNFEVLESRR